MTAPASPTVLELSGITKRFGRIVANEDVDLALRRGEILALLGENGAGKTTLMSILFGHYVADAGHVRVTDGADGLRELAPGSPQAALTAGIGMVHQHFTLADNLSVLDNIILGSEPLWRFRQRKRQARAKLAEQMQRSGLAVDLDAKTGALSVGERQRIEILKVLYRDVRVLILDEPTAVLTPQEADGLFSVLRRLADDGLAVIFISHKLDEVMAVSHRVAVLRAGRKVFEARTSEVDKPTLSARMVGGAVPESRRQPRAAGSVVLELSGAGVASTEGRTGLHDVDLTVHAGEIVGIAGVSGNGQAALSALVAGLAAPDHGVMKLYGEAVTRHSPSRFIGQRVGRIPEDRHRQGVVGTMSVWENLAIETARQPGSSALGFLRRRRLTGEAGGIIKRYDVRGATPDTEVRLLSGGNTQKLILGRVLERAPKLILANQPTRGLDVGAVAYVHERLLAARDDDAAILLISEDLEELMAVSDRIAVLFHGRLTEAQPVESLDIRTIGLLMAGQSAEPDHAGGAGDGTRAA